MVSLINILNMIGLTPSSLSADKNISGQDMTFDQLLQQGIDQDQELEQTLLNQEHEYASPDHQEAESEVETQLSEHLAEATNNSSSDNKDILSSTVSTQEKLIPLSTFAKGTLSQQSKTLYEAISSDKNAQAAAQVKQNINQPILTDKPVKATHPIQQQTTQNNQQGNVQEVKAKLNFEITDSYEAQLFKSTYNSSAEKYQLKNFKYIEAKDQNILLMRDYRLSKQQEEKLAQLAYQEFNNSNPNAKNTKVIINGSTYRSKS